SGAIHGLHCWGAGSKREHFQRKVPLLETYRQMAIRQHKAHTTTAKRSGGPNAESPSTATTVPRSEAVEDLRSLHQLSRADSTQNSLPSGSASTVHEASVSSWPTWTRVAPWPSHTTMTVPAHAMNSPTLAQPSDSSRVCQSD